MVRVPLVTALADRIKLPVVREVLYRRTGDTDGETDRWKTLGGRKQKIKKTGKKGWCKKLFGGSQQ